MILITGSVLAKPETFEELKRLCLEHTVRSRGEPGCELHAVHIDAENPLRLVFLEHWTDRAAVRAHFAVPASRSFVGQAGAELPAAPPVLELYESSKLSLEALASG